MATDPLSAIPEAFVEPVESFLAWLELERGLSSNTISAYTRDLAQYTQHLKKQGVADWASVGESDVSAWTAHLSEAEYARSSQARKLSAIRMLARHLVREGIRLDDFTELVSTPKLSRKLPEVLTHNELKRLLEAPVTSTPHGLRDRAMLELFYSSGLRVSELCGILLQAINLDDGYVRVFGKGSKERIAPIGSAAVTAVQDYLAGARAHFVKAKTGSELFLSQQGKAISRKMVWVLIKQYALKAGIKKTDQAALTAPLFCDPLARGWSRSARDPRDARAFGYFDYADLYFRAVGSTS